MSTSKTTVPVNRTVYDYWDYSFEKTDLHLDERQLRPWVQEFDALADACVTTIRSKLSAEAPGATKTPKIDMYAQLRDRHKDDPQLRELWSQVNTVPAWVDWEQIRRGQEVYYRYAIAISNVLLFLSLLGGMGSKRVSETLSRTGAFSANAVRRRLLETVQHSLQVTRSLESIQPGGEGQVSSVRVRLLHSSVRLRILELAKQDPQYYDQEKYGVPINDLDSAGTINTFSCAVIWLGLPRQGIYLSAQEIADYLALWRLVGHYMGAPTEPFATPAKAKAFMESLLVTEFQPNDTGRTLAQNIILGMENTAPTFTTKPYMDAMTRLLNGDKLSDELHIPPMTVYYKALMFGYCTWVKLLANTIPRIRILDKWVIAAYRRSMWETVMDRKEGLGEEFDFHFKYIPSLKLHTRLGKRKRYSFRRLGLEMLSYLGLAFTLGIVLTLSWGLFCFSTYVSYMGVRMF